MLVTHMHKCLDVFCLTHTHETLLRKFHCLTLPRATVCLQQQTVISTYEAPIVCLFGEITAFEHVEKQIFIQ